MNHDEAQDFTENIAVVGLAGRYPGAKNVDAFWQNLRDGVESISFFSDWVSSYCAVLRLGFLFISGAT